MPYPLLIPILDSPIGILESNDAVFTPPPQIGNKWEDHSAVSNVTGSSGVDV